MNDNNPKSTDLLQYADAVSVIKTAIMRCRYRSLSAVNKEALSLYFGVGKFVSENSRKGKWGSKAIPAISELLQKELPGLSGFSTTGIKRMRIFYEQWSDIIIRPSSMDELQIDENLLLTQIKQPIGDDFDWADFIKISFTHHYEILAGVKDTSTRYFYIHLCALNAWSVATLKNYIKADIYSNKGLIPNNFTTTLTDTQYAAKAVMSFKDEYLLDMVNVEDIGEKEADWNERVIEKQIVHHITDFILKFGSDFIFIGSQYRLIVADEEMFADLVFFNRELNASVIIELKRGRFRHNYIGQLNDYLTVYDMQKKKTHENPSIGIILCHDVNKKFVEILVRDYNKPIGVATYRTADEMPERLRKALPDMKKMSELINSIDSEN